MSQMAKDFWPIGEARKGQMYWMYMTFSQRSASDKKTSQMAHLFPDEP